MERNEARTIFEESRRFRAAGDRLVIRDVRLAEMIATIREEQLHAPVALRRTPAALAAA